MSNYNTQLQSNNIDLQEVLQALQNKAAGSGGADDVAKAIIDGTITEIKGNTVTSIRGCAFYGCSSLTTATFPACKTIGISAFCGCSSLTTANFPVCASIDYYAFIKCFNLSIVKLGASSVCVLSNSNAFSSTPFAGYSASFSGTPHIYVPASLVDAYKSATNWTYFSSYISAIEDMPS